MRAVLVSVLISSFSASGVIAQSRSDLQAIVNAQRAAQGRHARELERSGVINLSSSGDPSRELARILLARRAAALKKRRLSKKQKENADKFQLASLAGPLQLGDVGPLPGHHVNVLQVNGPMELRGEILGELSASKVECIVRGIPTAGMSGQSGHSIGKCFRVTGSARYLTVGGTFHTLPLIEPFDTSKAEQLFAEAIAPKKKAVTPRAPKDDAPITDPEAAAQKKFAAVLKNGRSLARAKIYDAARKDFERIVAGAPGTAIAKEAQRELDSLPGDE